MLFLLIKILSLNDCAYDHLEKIFIWEFAYQTEIPDIRLLHLNPEMLQKRATAFEVGIEVNLTFIKYSKYSFKGCGQISKNFIYW